MHGGVGVLHPAREEVAVDAHHEAGVWGPGESVCVLHATSRAPGCVSLEGLVRRG